MGADQTDPAAAAPCAPTCGGLAAMRRIAGLGDRSSDEAMREEPARFAPGQLAVAPDSTGFTDASSLSCQSNLLGRLDDKVRNIRCGISSPAPAAHRRCCAEVASACLCPNLAGKCRLQL